LFAVLLVLALLVMVGLIWWLSRFVGQLAQRVMSWSRPSAQRG
jgi:hypothetical protein